MPPITTDAIRQSYLEFFKSKGHAIIPGAPLIPENDPTVLFTTAGMHPLVPYLMGEKHPAGKRLVDVQRCIRTQDIDEVGDASHLTMFEMLGNWSLGDYFKEGAIAMSFEFLTKVLEIPLNKLAVTCFEGDNDAPKDTESAGYWMKMGMPEERIGYLPKAKNWWGPAGKTGPCGPDTEMFYWIGPSELPPKGSNPATDDANWLEIWNDVFMQYNKKEDGTFEPLKQQNVDTGMGLERVAKVLQKVESVYDTDRMLPVMKAIDERSPMKDKRHQRIVCDHIKAAVFIIMDGIKPSNVDQGYVLRRIIRRAIRSGRQLGITGQFVSQIALIVIQEFSGAYPALTKKSEEIITTLHGEEEQFSRTLEEGLKQFKKIVFKTTVTCPLCKKESASPLQFGNVKAFETVKMEDNTFQCPHCKQKAPLDKKDLIFTVKKTIEGAEAFHLYDTYGFPLELTKELAAEAGSTVDENGFQKAFAEHQNLSRAGAAQKFAGGLADHSAETTKLHTATHLLNAALHTVLGNHISQKGSNITAERLRFDFNHPDKMTPEQIAETERLVNEAIKADVPVSYHLTSVDGAKAEGAIGVFDDRYGSEVKVYVMGEVSKEICGGPHVARTGMIGSFKIQKEESSSAGVRRIKAIVSGGPAEIEVAREAN